MLRYLTIFIALTGATISHAAEDDFLVTARLQHLNGQINQMAIFPTWKISENGGVTITSISDDQVSELSAGLSWTREGDVFTSENKLLVGFLYLPKNYSTHLRISAFSCTKGKYSEISWLDAFDIPNHRPGMKYGTFHRVSLQIGSSENFLIGAQTEITTARRVKPLVTVGPKISFIKNDFRIDGYVGKVANDNLEIGNTPPTIMVWVSYTL